MGQGGEYGSVTGVTVFQGKGVWQMLSLYLFFSLFFVTK